MFALPEERRRCQPAWLMAALLTIILVWLHLFFWFHAGGFWRDEVNLINLSSRPSLAEMTHDSFPLLMPLFVRGWISVVGQNDFLLRLLGVLLGLSLVAAFWVVAWITRRPPLISLVLVGLNTTAIIYGDSLRGYGLGSVIIVLTTGTMWFFLKNPTWWRAALLATMAMLSVQALYQNAVLVGAICFGAWLVCWRRNQFRAAGKILLAGIFAAFSLLPYWPVIAALPKNSALLRRGFQPGVVFEKLTTLLAFPLPEYLYVWGLLVLAVTVLGAVAGLARNDNSALPAPEDSPAELSLFAAGTGLAALVGFSLFLWYAALLTQPWYFLPVLALLATGFDFGLWLPGCLRRFHAVCAGLLLATSMVGVMFAQRDLDWQFTNLDRLARQVNSQAGPQDFVLVTPWYCGISFARYVGNGITWQTLPPLADHTIHRYDLVRERMQTATALEPVLNKMATALRSGNRIWIVGNLSLPRPGPPPAALPPPPLEKYGWSDLPYELNWDAQAACFIASHSLQFVRMDHETNGSVRDSECLRLFAASGWKNLATETNEP